MYKCELKSSWGNYEGEGKTPFDALASLGLEWNQIKGKAEITLFKGEVSASKLYLLPKLKLLFGRKLAMQLQAKYLNYLLEAKLSAHKLVSMSD